MYSFYTTKIKVYVWKKPVKQYLKNLQKNIVTKLNYEIKDKQRTFF